MTDSASILTINLAYPRLDAAVAPECKAELEEAGVAGRKRVMLNMEAVEFVDSTGLGVLVALLKMMGSGGRIAVVSAAPAVLRLFQITRLDTLFILCENADDAQTALAA